MDPTQPPRHPPASEVVEAPGGQHQPDLQHPALIRLPGVLPDAANGACGARVLRHTIRTTRQLPLSDCERRRKREPVFAELFGLLRARPEHRRTRKKGLSDSRRGVPITAQLQGHALGAQGRRPQSENSVEISVVVAPDRGKFIYRRGKLLGGIRSIVVVIEISAAAVNSSGATVKVKKNGGWQRERIKRHFQ